MSDTHEIPLFPLGSVLLPHGRMPLQIFEPRYLDLVRDCVRDDSGFGVAWIRRGEEVARPGQASPQLGDWGTYARIIDWDQLENGLLGITVEGQRRFHLHSSHRSDTGLVLGEVSLEAAPQASPLPGEAESLVAVLKSLEIHPHVQQMNLAVDYANAWEVAYTLVQLLPLDEALKYHLLGLTELERLLAGLDTLLNQISGED